MTSVDEILNEVEKQTNISRQELIKRMNKKQESLSGLVSLEGAAHLVARELGIDLLDKTRRRLEMKNIVGGMKNVNVVGRVFRISNVNEFKRSDGSEGRVVNIFLGDSSDYIRLALWDKQVNLVEDETIKIGDVIQIVNGMARENVFGGVEISLGKYGSIKSVEEDVKLPSLEELSKRLLSSTPKKIFIKDISSGLFEIQGNIVHIFKSDFIFKVCSICGSKVEEKDGKFICEEHGKVEPDSALVISTVVDDSSGNLRVVFFRDVAEKSLEMSADELAGLDKERRFGVVKEKLLGKELLLLGRVKKNKIFDMLELIVNNFEELNVFKRSKELIDEIELKIGG